ncbi:MAG: hypothetical protein MUP64_10320 [Anaerolineae bacterium]|nr:hypothetical protein [Anaerolineae bacterium]
MMRTVKHFSLHRIASPAGAGLTELRVVSDVEAGVLPVIQIEEAVIQGYARQGHWPHRWVTLFVLQDLQPLIRQLTPTPSLPLLGGGSQGGGPALPPGGAAALDLRPVVNVYDLADLDSCHVFVNQQAMVKEGYWDDPLAIRGLLAHEHAHPLAENLTTQASRQLQVALALDQPWSNAGLGDRQGKVQRLLTLLADKLSVYAPREIFANELTIRSGFGDGLFHLARRTVAGRDELSRQLRQEVTQGTLTPAAASLLLLIGDLRGYLDLALEIAPFYRSGQESEARQLEAVLEADILPHLEPQVAGAYSALREHYLSLLADLSPPALRAWSEGVLGILANALAEKGLTLQYHLEIA